jgi:hypothetical protein
MQNLEVCGIGSNVEMANGVPMKMKTWEHGYRPEYARNAAKGMDNR